MAQQNLPAGPTGRSAEAMNFVYDSATDTWYPQAGATGGALAVGAKYNVTLPTYTDGQRTDLQAGTKGQLLMAQVDANGSAITGAPSADGLATTTQGLNVNAVQRIFNGTTLDRLSKATTVSRIPSAAATTNATSAKASAGTVYNIDCVNTTAAVKYLKLYNKASAPTVGTDTPVLTIALSPSNARTTVPFHAGMYFATGIAYALTGAAADADTTALVAGDVVGVNIAYS